MYWPAMFSMFAFASGVCGFGGIAGPTAWLAEILCVAFGILAVVCTVDHFRRRATAPREH